MLVHKNKTFKGERRGPQKMVTIFHKKIDEQDKTSSNALTILHC